MLFSNGIGKELKYSEIFICADDVRLFREVCSPLDQSKLQRDLDSVFGWARVSGLRLNTEKCSLLTFHRGGCFDTSYVLGNVNLVRMSEQRDLGVIFQRDFEFDLQLRSVVNKSFGILGLIIRSSGLVASL